MGVVRVLQGQFGTIGQSNAQIVGGSIGISSNRNHYLSRTFSAGNRKTWTWSGWVKRSTRDNGVEQYLFSFTQTSPNNQTYIRFEGGDIFRVAQITSGSVTWNVSPSMLFRDYSAWYHIVVAHNSTESTSSNRVKIYVNNVRVANFSAAVYPSLDNQANINDTVQHAISSAAAFGFGHFDGQLSNVHFLDGQALDPSYFGYTDPLTNTWRPKQFTGDFGSKAVFNAALNATPFTDSIGSTITNNGNVTTTTASTNNFGITTAANFAGDGRLTTTYTPVSKFTCDVFFNHNNTTGDSYVLGQGSGAFIQVNPGAVGTNIILYGSTNVDLGSYGFKHLRIQYDGSTTIVWSNGTQVYSDSLSPAGGIIYVGAHGSSTGRFFVGQIGPVRFTHNLLGAPPSGGLTVRSDGTLSDFSSTGSNSFYLPFDEIGNDANAGKDKSGRGNDWTLNNFVTTAAGINTDPNIRPESPSGISLSTSSTVGIGTTTGMTKPNNYCTLNPLRCTGTSPAQGGESTLPVFSENNLEVQNTQNATWKNSGTTIDIPSGVGKWYWEAQPVIVSGSDGVLVGIASEGFEWNRDTYYTGLPWIGSSTGTSWGIFSVNGQKFTNGSGSAYISGGYGINDTIGVALDAEATTLTFYLNGASQGIAFTGVTAGSNKFLQIGTSVHGSARSKIRFNFGQKPFKYAPPAGHLPVCTANLPKPSIVRPDQYVGIVTYTGNNTDNRKITVGFKPDLVWFKSRSNSGVYTLFDSIRGTLALDSSALDGDTSYGTPPVGGYLNTFETDGFTLKNGSINNTYVNENGYTYVAWAWKAGGQIGVGRSFMINDVGFATAGDARMNTGTITPTAASVNTKSGFSIITYTGTGNAGTISHGLGAVPSLILFKNRDASTNWRGYHRIGDTYYDSEGLNTTSVLNSSGSTVAGYMNSTNPTSSVFSLGGGGYSINVNGEKMVAYCWTEIPGFSKFGSYITNASGDAGPTHFIYTGFRPAWLLIKRVAGGTNWILRDSKRGSYNPINATLAVNSSSSESGIGDVPVDFVSNGFVLRDLSGVQNGPSGATNTYIYAAFAESPTQNLYGGQSNAR